MVRGITQPATIGGLTGMLIIGVPIGATGIGDITAGTGIKTGWEPLATSLQVTPLRAYRCEQSPKIYSRRKLLRQIDQIIRYDIPRLVRREVSRLAGSVLGRAWHERGSQA